VPWDDITRAPDSWFEKQHVIPKSPFEPDGSEFDTDFARRVGNIELGEETSKGLRQFNKNMERLKNQILAYGQRDSKKRLR